MKKLFLAVGILVGVLFVSASLMFVSISSNMKVINETEISELNLQDITDGTHRGKYYFKDQIGATVDVVVKDGVITDITIIEHITGLGSKAESIIDDITKEQSIFVDDISGATTSSHVIKLAIENALEDK